MPLEPEPTGKPDATPDPSEPDGDAPPEVTPLGSPADPLDDTGDDPLRLLVLPAPDTSPPLVPALAPPVVGSATLPVSAHPQRATPASAPNAELKRRLRSISTF
jgi:hypothetical protein